MTPRLKLTVLLLVLSAAETDSMPFNTDDMRNFYDDPARGIINDKPPGGKWGVNG